MAVGTASVVSPDVEPISIESVSLLASSTSSFSAAAGVEGVAPGGVGHPTEVVMRAVAPRSSTKAVRRARDTILIGCKGWRYYECCVGVKIGFGLMMERWAFMILIYYQASYKVVL